MQKRFTAQVPQRVLNELGWYCPATYAEVFDYLSENGMLISISRYYDFADKEGFGDGYDWCVDCEKTLRTGDFGYGETWIDAANEAIRCCCEQL